MEALFNDLKFGARMLARTPGFTLVALITIALGIGANTAIFSVVNTVLLRPLPYQNPDKLVVLWERQDQIDQVSPSLPDFLDWRSRNESFEQMAVARRDNINLTGAGEPERLLVRQVTANFFSTLGATPAMGRVFTIGEDQAGKNYVVVLSHNFWQRRFGGDPNILNRQITLNGESYTVVGVMPASFQYGREFGQVIDLWAPIVFTPLVTIALVTSAPASVRATEHSNAASTVALRPMQRLVARVAPGVAARWGQLSRAQRVVVVGSSALAAVAGISLIRARRPEAW